MKQTLKNFVQISKVCRSEWKFQGNRSDWYLTSVTLVGEGGRDFSSLISFLSSAYPLRDTFVFRTLLSSPGHNYHPMHRHYYPQALWSLPSEDNDFPIPQQVLVEISVAAWTHHISLFLFTWSVDGPNLTARDVSILVTQASPECPTAPTPKNRLLSEPSTSTLVHVLVHRESEEYQTDLEDGSTEKGTCRRLSASQEIPKIAPFFIFRWKFHKIYRTYTFASTFRIRIECTDTATDRYDNGRKSTRSTEQWL